MKKTILGLIIFMVVLSTNVGILYAKDDTISDQSDDLIIIEESKSDSSRVIIGNPNSTADKEQILAAIDLEISNSKKGDSSVKKSMLSYSVQSAVPMAVKNSYSMPIISLYDYQYSDHNEYNGSFTSKVDTNITNAGGFNYRADGIAKVSWTGSYPFHCDEIKLVDTWEITGISVGITHDGGYIVTGNIFKKVLTWTKAHKNNFVVVHDFNNVQFSNISSVGVKQSCQGDFTFGTYTKTLFASDSAQLIYNN